MFIFVANKVASFGLRRDFQNLFQHGFISKKRGVVIHAAKNTKNQTRLAWGISKKNVRKAVQRNKIKRWGREVLRNNEELAGLSLDFLIIVQKEINHYVEFKKIMDELVQETLKKNSKNSHFSRSCL